MMTEQEAITAVLSIPLPPNVTAEHQPSDYHFDTDFVIRTQATWPCGRTRCAAGLFRVDSIERERPGYAESLPSKFLKSVDRLMNRIKTSV